LDSGGGAAYQIDFAAADPYKYTPEVPYPEGTKRIWGRGDGEGSIPNAKFNNGDNRGGSSDVQVESLMPPNMYMGQIVPFEIKISVTPLIYPEDGMQFTAGWSTVTTGAGDFGYDPEIGVLAAFIDTADGAHLVESSDTTLL
jgi:hypothetical protein